MYRSRGRDHRKPATVARLRLWRLVASRQTGNRVCPSARRLWLTGPDSDTSRNTDLRRLRPDLPSFDPVTPLCACVRASLWLMGMECRTSDEIDRLLWGQFGWPRNLAWQIRWAVSHHLTWLVVFFVTSYNVVFTNSRSVADREDDACVILLHVLN